MSSRGGWAVVFLLSASMHGSLVITGNSRSFGMMMTMDRDIINGSISRGVNGEA